MENKYTKEEIKKALEQADANISFEEVDINEFEKGKSKVLRKENKNDSR